MFDVNFTGVKLYYNDIYIGWQTKKPSQKEKSFIYEEAYFIKADGRYFKLGDEGYYVFEND